MSEPKKFVLLFMLLILSCALLVYVQNQVGLPFLQQISDLN